MVYHTRWFNPRQKWLTKKIPKTYCDCVDLPWICLSEILIHFVEVEEGLESIWGDNYLNDPYVSDDYRLAREPVRKELEEIYEYVKTGRPQLQKELDESYPEPINGGCMLDYSIPIIEEDGKTVMKYREMKSCEEIYGMSFKEAYFKVHMFEALIEERDTWAMTGIINNRQFLWT